MANRELMLKVAQLKFERGLFNDEIAKQLFQEKLRNTEDPKGITPLIEETGRWLMQEHEALEALRNSDTPEKRLAAQLCEKFGLLNARVVAGGNAKNEAEYAELMRNLGRAGAEYFDELVVRAEDNKQELHVAVSGGQTVLDIVYSLSDRRRANVQYYAAALIGRGSMTRAPHVGPETTTTIAWSRSGRVLDALHYGTIAPYEIDTQYLNTVSNVDRHRYGLKSVAQELADLMETPNVRKVLDDLHRNVNVAIAGIGLVQAPRSQLATFGKSFMERLTVTRLLTPLGISAEMLEQDGAIGELSYSLFDVDGQGRSEWHFFPVAGDGSRYAGVDFYRHLVAKGNPVIVAAPMSKWQALLPAIKARLFNVLVTDTETAERLMQV